MLRPMRVGEMLDAAITLYRLNWRPFMGVVAVIYVPFVFIQELAIRLVSHPFLVGGRVYVTHADTTRVGIVTAVFTLLSFLLIQPLATGAMVKAVSDAYLGEHPTVRGVYGYAVGVIGSLLLVIFLRLLLVMVGLILLIIPGIIVYVRLAFATSTVVVEQARGRAALRRSWELSRENFWKIFGTTLLAGVMAGIVAGIITVPLGLAATRMTEGWILRAIGTAIGQVLVSPFTTTIVVLLYFDMRIRKEGLDLAMMAREIRRESGGLQP
jgi:membrane-anchored glycerophosphoryl diester phosphodiesterase (GDPDase)